MYDMKPLEEEWKKYQTRKRKPLYFGLFFLFLIILSFFFLNNNSFNLKYFNQFFQTLTQASVKDSNNNLSESYNHVLVNDGLTKLEVLDLQDSRSQIDDSTNPNGILVDIPILALDNEVPKVNVGSDRKKIVLDIIETSSITAYEDVEKRFLQSHDIDDALFLAKSYYKKSNYDKAKYWAYEVNKLNENIEEGLFIFVKSKVHLGQKNEGLSILKRYIKKSNSKEAKALLHQIENNILQ